MVFKIVPESGSKYKSLKSKKNVFFKIQSWKKIIPDAVISGSDVRKVTLTKKKEKNEFVYEMFAEGDVLKTILMIDEVDATQTYSNNINEILRVLGVEAARKAIINEVQKTIKVHSLNID